MSKNAQDLKLNKDNNAVKMSASSFFTVPTESPGHTLNIIEDLKPLLNSQRIEKLFGSYGVEILFQNDEIRISNLHSLDNVKDATTMRTCAIVNYSLPMPQPLQDAHIAIVNGGSIGATLKSTGFTISKKPLYFGEVALPQAAKDAMKIDAETAAVHIYRLCVGNGQTELDYCTISEIHSPKYLITHDLSRLYSKDYGSHNKITSAVSPYIDKINELDSTLRLSLYNI